MKIGQLYVEKQKRQGEKLKFALLGAVCLAVIGLITAAGPKDNQPAKPEGAAGYYTKDGQTVWLVPGVNMEAVPGKGLSPLELEAMYPMSPAEEAKIVHVIPRCPVIIDGVKYKAEDVTLFNGKRLHFITGKDGQLYAFTTADGVEEFYQKNFAKPSSVINKSVQLQSMFYLNMWFSGESLGADPGQPYAVLPPPFDNAISSVIASAAAPRTILYDLPYFQGDTYITRGGCSYSMLLFQGWNDRASSVYVPLN